MLYTSLRFLVRLALRVWFRRVTWHGEENLPTNKPILLTANHPNSAMDAIILACLLNRPLHFLARSDVFRKPLVNWLLRKINMLPVYRISEGYDQLNKNQDTFGECIEVFRMNGIVLIFPEGSHSFQRILRPLKKGAVKLALQAYHAGTDMYIGTVGINYISPDKPRSELIVTFGNAIRVADIAEKTTLSTAQILHQLNQQIAVSLRSVIINIPSEHMAEAFSWVYELRNSKLGKGRSSSWVSHSSTQWQQALSVADWLNTSPTLPPKPTKQAMAWHQQLFCVLVFLLNAIPLLIAKYITEQKVKMREFYATVRFVLSFLLVLIYYVIIGIICYLTVSYRR
jgi:1-acyl-sn-glycerol-3-phosphate acyltransferase